MQPFSVKANAWYLWTAAAEFIYSYVRITNTVELGLYRGADNSLDRPGKKHATATKL